MTEPAVQRARIESTTVFLIRHGDRWDFANWKRWRSAAALHGFEVRDPPLSALGHEQARCVAAALEAEGIDTILASPYLRVIQTAQPLAHACNMAINIEEGLAETAHVIGSVPTAVERFPMFPEIDVDYKPMHAIAASGADHSGRPQEIFPSEYLKRMILMAKLIPQRFSAKCIACFSHAASVAFVAALTGKSLFEVGKFAPCGIFKLVSNDGQTWILESHGGDNSEHVQRNDLGTFPWGFMNMRLPASSNGVQEDQLEISKELLDVIWEEAKGCNSTPAS